VLKLKTSKQKTATKINVVCLKTGDKYGVEYVHKLHSMLLRNLNLNFSFYVITDSFIRDYVCLAPSGYGTWWDKLEVFKIFDHPTPTLFIDLDTVIVDNIGDMVEWGIEQLEIAPLVIIEDFNRPRGYGSGVFMFKGGLSHVYASFRDKSSWIMANIEGDQNWLEATVPVVSFWPREWVVSYKNDMRDKGLTDVPKGSKVVCFHGNPKNHQIGGLWIERHWYEGNRCNSHV